MAETRLVGGPADGECRAQRGRPPRQILVPLTPENSRDMSFDPGAPIHPVWEAFDAVYKDGGIYADGHRRYRYAGTQARKSAKASVSAAWAHRGSEPAKTGERQ